MLFNVCDLDLNQMILILKLDLLNMVTYLHAQNEVIRSNGLQIMAKNTDKVMLFINACDIDFHQMTLILKHDLDIIVTYFHV